MIPVGRLAPGDQWDQNMLDLLFDNRLYATGLEFNRVEGYPNTDGAVLIVPGRYWADRVDDINQALRRYRWVLLMRVGDEEDSFDIRQITHPRARFWVQTPSVGSDYGSARLFGVGFPPHLAGLPPTPPDKHTDVVLAAQKTHARRQEAFAALNGLPINQQLIATEGFTQGLEPRDYAALMLSAKLAPAPSGPVSPDTFRLYEALEAHCVPIADGVSPTCDVEGFWEILFPGCPFPVLTNYESLPGYVFEGLEQWPANANRIAAFWLRYKRKLAHWLVEDLEALGAL